MPIPRRRVLPVVVLAIASLVVATVPPLAGAAAPVARAAAPVPPRHRLPGAVADARLDRIIHADQIALVSRAPRAAVGAARAALAADERTLATRGAVVGRDADLAARASAVEAADTAVVQADTVRRQAAAGAHARADATVTMDRRRLESLAVDWYVGGASSGPLTSATLAAAQGADDVNAELMVITDLSTAALGHDVTVDKAAGVAASAAASALRHAQAALGADLLAAQTAVARRFVDADALSTARTEVAGDRVTLRARQRTLAGVVAAFDGPGESGAAPVPSILGVAALTPAEMVGWFDDSGDAAATSTPITTLAAWYVAEGRAEGVRGDIAFAQAVLETGGFTSVDAVARNNYAGIGHCDSCGGGLRFASARAGVRGQIQLLRTFADARLTTAQLPSPPPLAILAPQKQAVRGCCRTWNSLTGVWATDRSYGRTLLQVYAEMLGSAVARVAPAPPAPGTAAG